MVRSASRSNLAALAAAVACGSIVGCSSGQHINQRDCGYSVTWQARVYVGLVYVHPPPRMRVLRPAAGRPLGHGFVPQCPGDSTGSPAIVYEVPGISAREAVMVRTNDERTLRPELLIRRGHPIPDALLTHR